MTFYAKSLKRVVLVCIFCCSINLSLLSAQTSLLSKDNLALNGDDELLAGETDPPGMGDLPIDGGLSILIAAGTALGYQRLRKRKTLTTGKKNDALYQ